MSSGAMGVSAKVAIAVIVVIALGSSQSFAAPQPNSGSLSYSEVQFTRCDNSTQPIGKVEISACKDRKEYCIFKLGSIVTAEFEFTPEKTHKSSTIGFDFMASTIGNDVCEAEGAECPFEAGVKQHVKAKIPIIFVGQKGRKVRLFLTDDWLPSKPYWYCVEFPARLA